MSNSISLSSMDNLSEQGDFDSYFFIVGEMNIVVLIVYFYCKSFKF